MSDLVITSHNADNFDAIVLVGRWESNGKMLEHCEAVPVFALEKSFSNLHGFDPLEEARRKIREAFDLSKELTA